MSESSTLPDIDGGAPANAGTASAPHQRRPSRTPSSCSSATGGTLLLPGAAPERLSAACGMTIPLAR